jgi:hypothetical protein
MATDVDTPSGGQVESKGLKAGALGLVSATVVGVASAAPAYSLAAVLGFVVAAGVGFKSPAIMWISFIPMGCIAAAFFYLNSRCSASTARRAASGGSWVSAASSSWA